MLYSILIYGEDGVFDRLPEAEQSKYMDMHISAQATMKANGSYRGAIRLMPPTTAVTVKQQAGVVNVLDGPFAETKEQIVGFYLVEMDSIEAATEMAKLLPQGVANMEVRPVHWGEQSLVQPSS